MFKVVIFLIQATGNANPDSITYLSSGYHIWNDKAQVERGDEFYSVVQEKRTLGPRVERGALNPYDVGASLSLHANFPGYVQVLCFIYDYFMDDIQIFPMVFLKFISLGTKQNLLRIQINMKNNQTNKKQLLS